MPEGDTIFRAAAKLRQSIEGATICEATAGNPEDSDALRPLPLLAPSELASLAGEPVANIEARGKHLLIRLADTRVIHSHLGMDGAWHTYRPQQPWHKPARQAELVLRFANVLAVCFSPKLLELLTAGEAARHRWLARLGPDLLATQFDVADAVTRFRRHDRLPIGEAVMNQTIVCGIGNVYKSELLFLDRVHPLTKVAELSDETLTSIITRARKLLQRNVMGGPRRTRFRGDGHNLWTYGRQGEAGLKCGEKIRLTRQGDLGRTTYFCPACQRAEV